MRKLSSCMRALALASLLGAGALGSAWSQAEPVSSGEPLGLYVSAGLGFESETGRPGAFVAREVLSATKGRLGAAVDLSSALGVAGTDSSLLDAAGLGLTFRLSQRKENAFYVDTFIRYRFLFLDASELRLGGTLRASWGVPSGTRGLSGDWALGFEGICTSIEALPAPLWEGNPLLSLGLGWRFSDRWYTRAGLESFTDEDATYFPRTLFDFLAGLDLPGLSLQARLILKYSDFFTPTGYLDGLAFRLGARIPLKTKDAP